MTENYAEFIAQRKPTNPAVEKILGLMMRSGLLEEIERESPEKQVELLNDCMRFMAAQASK
ncbi:MAG: hypothetical protein WCK01_04850 [Candidatus Uhrbacteria bacterium]